MMPGWQRAALRLAALAALAGLWRWRTGTERTGTEWGLALIGGPAAGVAAWRAVRRVLLARHHRRVVGPLAAALAVPLESPPAEVARTLAVPRVLGPDAQVTAALPDHYQGTPGQVDAAARIVGQRLGGEWQARVSRSPLALIVARRPAPPESVTFGQVAPLIGAQGSATRVLMGMGAGDVPVWLDFDATLAHLGLSVGTGGGKSAFLRFVVAQFAHWGVADFPVIDSGFVSLAGMESVPGLRVYRDPPEQWEALAELAADMDARYAAMLADPSATFPLCVITLEEQNDAAIAWRAYWREVKGPRDPATPPVYGDITRIMVKGRKVGYRVIGSYQRLTAAACGGLDAGVMRDAYGSKALARFGPQAWDALTGIRPRAESSAVPGRFVQVIGSDVRAVQVPRAEAAELVAFARSGTVGTPPPWAGPRGPVPPVSVPPEPGRYPRLVAVSGDGVAAVVRGPGGLSPASVPPGVVVGLAAAAELLGMSLEAFRKARARRPITGELPPDAAGRPRWPAEVLTCWRASRPSAASEGVA
jgi:hypothetical protein